MYVLEFTSGMLVCYCKYYFHLVGDFINIITFHQRKEDKVGLKPKR